MQSPHNIQLCLDGTIEKKRIFQKRLDTEQLSEETREKIRGFIAQNTACIETLRWVLEIHVDE